MSIPVEMTAVERWATEPRTVALAASLLPDPHADPALICASFGLRLAESDLGGYVHAVYFPDTIVCSTNPALGPNGRRFAFLHEIGHHAVATGRAPHIPPEREEAFCDGFACAALALDPAVLADGLRGLDQAAV
jgi:hypothetical protein